MNFEVKKSSELFGLKLFILIYLLIILWISLILYGEKWSSLIGEKWFFGIIIFQVLGLTWNIFRLYSFIQTINLAQRFSDLLSVKKKFYFDLLVCFYLPYLLMSIWYLKMGRLKDAGTLWGYFSVTMTLMYLIDWKSLQKLAAEEEKSLKKSSKI